jgi:hypothetical protein
VVPIILWSLTIVGGCALGWRQASIKLKQVIYLLSAGLGMLALGISIGRFVWKIPVVEMISLSGLHQGVIIISLGYVAIISVIVAGLRLSVIKFLGKAL